MFYFCTLYGVTVKSTFLIDEAIEIEPIDNPDVLVEEGSMPDEVHESQARGVFGRFADEYHWFFVDALGYFLIENGNHIVYEKVDGDCDYTVLTYLNGLAFALLFTQRGLVPMHGSVLTYNGKGCLITGSSGSGKSSTAIELLRSGAMFVADDVGMVDSKTMLVNPGFPIQRLCADQVERLGFSKSELRYLGEKKNKYARRLSEEEYNYDKCSLDMIINIKPYEGDELVCYEVTGSDKLKVVLNNIYCSFFVRDMQMKPESMLRYMQIASKTKIYMIKRPKGVNTLDSIVKYVQGLF